MPVEFRRQRGHRRARILDNHPGHRHVCVCRPIRDDGNRTAANGVCGKIRARRLQPLQCDEDIARLHLARVVCEATNVDSWQRGKRSWLSSRQLIARRGDARATGVRSSFNSHAVPGSIGVPGDGVWLVTTPFPVRRAVNPIFVRTRSASRALNPRRSGRSRTLPFVPT